MHNCMKKLRMGKHVSWEYKGEEGHIKHLFIKRPVPYLVEGVQYYDLVTPYGYGGPILLTFQKIIQKRCLSMPLKKCLKSIVRKNE